MNQILVTEKLYVTPEIKRKKKIYKFNLIISIVIIVMLSLLYARSEYAKGKEQEISDDILAQLIQKEEKNTVEENEIAKEDEGVWKIMMASTVEKQVSQEEIASNEKVEKKRTTVYTVKGVRYQSLGRITIPKIGVDNVILDKPGDDEQLVEWLKVSPCKFYGADPNEIGNCSIAGHNYRNKRFFSKVPKLVEGDEIEVTDASGLKITYRVFEKYEVEPSETDCLYKNIPGKRMITLITCTDDSKLRVIVHAVEV